MRRRRHPAPDSLSGETEQRFGNYLVRGLIGHGGFATVYRAEFMGEFGFRKEVALKVLRRRLHSLEERVSAEFLNEARLGASIRHPNLVEFYECGRVGDRLYIAMELIAGPNLAQVMRMVPDLVDPLDDHVILAIAMQTARGVKGLHEAQVQGRKIEAIHRDLKPGNILLSQDGQAKITDYGITRFAADFYQTLDHKGPRGSPLYMSPEQARGEELTQASDVFSFGTTVLEMITGTPVFAASSVQGIVSKVRDGDVGEALASGRKRFPHLVPVLEECLMPDPETRIPDGSKLVEALKSIEPPPFGDELISQLSKHAFGILRSHQEQRRQTPVLKFWSQLTGGAQKADELTDPGSVDDEDYLPVPEPIADLVEGESSEPEPTGEALVGGIVGSTTSRGWFEEKVEDTLKPGGVQRNLPWLIAGVSMGLLLVVLLGWGGTVLIRGMGEGDGIADGDPTPEPATGAETPTAGDGSADGGEEPTDGGEEPTDGGEEPTDGGEEPTADDGGTEPETATASDDGSASVEAPTAEPPTEAATPAATAQLQHTAVKRTIRGQDTTIAASVSPPGAYQVTLWYRAAPDGPWQTRVSNGGGDGSLRLVIPAGDWLAQGVTHVEYFIEATGPGGAARSGSAIQPHRVRVY